MKIVVNASPLIFLAKIHKLELLIELLEEVIIPMQVFAEVVTKGKEKGMNDAFLIENFTGSEKIKLKNVDIHGLEGLPMGEGEKAVIALARKEGIDYVLIDERKARFFAKIFKLNPRGVFWVLSLACSKDKISRQELKKLVLRVVQEEYRIKEEILARFLAEIER
jgi:predicted nucleic acid-binding protein